MAATFLIKKPVISEKATLLAEQGSYLFVVHADANKNGVRKEMQSRFGVRVKTVRMVRIPARRMRKGGKIGYRPGFKKALVVVAKGEKLDFS